MVASAARTNKAMVSKSRLNDLFLMPRFSMDLRL
nr:MAG TPA: hypothetical protein [Caudoviricetes sp.]